MTEENSIKNARAELLRVRHRQLKQKGEEKVMAGSRTAYLKDEDREILKTIVQNHFKNLGYSDEMIVQKVNDADLLKLDGAKISVQHVVKVRKDLGLRKKSGRIGSRSKKTRDLEDKPVPVRRTGRRMHYKLRPTARTKKDHTIGDNHPITIADLLSSISGASEAIETVKHDIQLYAQQERERIGV